MTHFPLFFDLKDKKVLIFGGGAFTLQRIEKLKPFSPRITVISQKISDPIKQINGITWEERSFCEKDLDIAPAFVIIAEDKKTTATIMPNAKNGRSLLMRWICLNFATSFFRLSFPPSIFASVFPAAEFLLPPRWSSRNALKICCPIILMRFSNGCCHSEIR